MLLFNKQQENKYDFRKCDNTWNKHALDVENDTKLNYPSVS